MMESEESDFASEAPVNLEFSCIEYKSQISGKKSAVSSKEYQSQTAQKKLAVGVCAEKSSWDIFGKVVNIKPSLNKKLEKKDSILEGYSIDNIPVSLKFFELPGEFYSLKEREEKSKEKEEKDDKTPQNFETFDVIFLIINPIYSLYEQMELFSLKRKAREKELHIIHHFPKNVKKGIIDKYSKELDELGITNSENSSPKERHYLFNEESIIPKSKDNGNILIDKITLSVKSSNNQKDKNKNKKQKVDYTKEKNNSFIPKTICYTKDNLFYIGIESNNYDKITNKCFVGEKCNFIFELSGKKEIVHLSNDGNFACKNNRDCGDFKTKLKFPIKELKLESREPKYDIQKGFATFAYKLATN